MELSEAIFGLVHAVRNNMKQEIKLLSIDLAPMHLKSLKVISIIDNCTGQKLADFEYSIKWQAIFRQKKLMILSS